MWIQVLRSVALTPNYAMQKVAAITGEQTELNISATFQVANGTSFGASARQTSGTTLNISTLAYSSYITIVRLV